MINSIHGVEARLAPYDIILFIGGLKEEIGLAVRMFKPINLTDVYCLSKMQEATIATSKSKNSPLLTTPRTNVTSTNVNRVGEMDL